MASAGGSKDIGDQKESPVSCSNMIDGDSFIVKRLSFGGVLHCQLRPRSFRATLHNQICSRINYSTTVQQMEEHLKYFLLGQQIVQPLEQILNLQPLLNTTHIKQIRLPLDMRRFKVNLQVLHAVIYYVIGIEKNICCEGSAEFREKCLAEISNYYIKKKMNFELYEYSYLCSRILSLPIEKVLHIVYYMVYARLASKPFIDNLVAQHHKKPRNNRKNTVKSQNQGSLHSKSMDSRHFTVFVDNHQLEIDIFRKDLRKALNSPSQNRIPIKKSDNKRYFNLTKVYPDQQDHFFTIKGAEDNPFISDTSRRRISIPLKVGPSDNSSIISRLKYAPKDTEERQNCVFKKIQLRRQKFNEQFDCGKKYEALERQQEKDLKKTGTMRVGGEENKKISNAHLLQKQPFQYFSSMASSIKLSNKQLDQIRSDCTSHVLKKIGLRENQWNRQRKDSEAKFKAKDNNYIQSNRQTEPLAHYLQLSTENKSKTEGPSQSDEKKRLELLQKAQDQGEKGEGLNDLITRKANLCGQQGRLLLFGKKMKNKFKVQKYKEQYRQFLKTQMFQRVRSIL